MSTPLQSVSQCWSIVCTLTIYWLCLNSCYLILEWLWLIRDMIRGRPHYQQILGQSQQILEPSLDPFMATQMRNMGWRFKFSDLVNTFVRDSSRRRAVTSRLRRWSRLLVQRLSQCLSEDQLSHCIWLLKWHVITSTGIMPRDNRAQRNQVSVWWINKITLDKWTHDQWHIILKTLLKI